MLRASPARRPTRRGASVVEFAVVVPLLFAMILGIVEFGRLFMVAQVTTNGSREGARYAAQADRTVADVDAYTKEYLAAAGIPASAVVTSELTYQVPPSDPKYTTANGGWVAVADLKAVPAGAPVRLRLEVDFEQVTWLPSGVFVAKGSRVSGVTVMRKE